MTNTETTKTAQILKDACASIAGNCDGAITKDSVGFNKADTSFGRSISLAPAKLWTPEICHEVRSMLKKYSGQLRSVNIEHNELPMVERQSSRGRSVEASTLKKIAAKVVKDNARHSFRTGQISEANARKTLGNFRLMEIVGKDLVASFPYDRDLIDAIKTINYRDRRWDSISKTWAISANAAGFVLHLIADWDFMVTDADLERIKHASNRTPPEAPKPKSKSTVTFSNDRIVLTTPYNPKLTDGVRGIEGRKWDAENKINTFPVTQSAAVLKLTTNYNLYVSDEARATLENFETLRVQKVKQSSAVDSHIKIPGLANDIELYPFQKAGVEYALETKRVILSDSMGLGKSPQAMCTVQVADAYPCLVICPKAVKAQWVTEINKFLPGRTATALNVKTLVDDKDFSVINYEILNKRLGDLKTAGFKSIIVDESHYIKSSKAQRSVATKEIIEHTGAEYVILLTGTPVLNRPVELTNQLDAIGRLDSNFGGFFKFALKYCDATQGSHGWNFKGASNLDELSVRLRETCFIRREKKDVCVELPELQRSIINVEIADKLKFRRAVKEVAAWMEDVHENRRLNPREYRSAAMIEIGKLKKLAVECKYKNALDWTLNALESEEKMVIFAHHKDIQAKLYNDLSDHNPARISSDDNDAKRAANIKKFWNDDTCRVIVVSMKAGNVGLNLQNASNCVFFEFAWHAADMDQAEARIHRIGSESAAINSYWLAAEGTFDDELIDIIESKRSVTDAINNGYMSDEEFNIVKRFETLLKVNAQMTA